jgi:hypothetical protein
MPYVATASRIETGRPRRDDAPQGEAGLGEEATELPLRPFPRAAEHRHHLHVMQIADRPTARRVGVEYKLADQQERLRSHRRAAGAQDAQAVLVAPVVQHADQQIDVRTGRDAVEEAARRYRDPPLHQPLGRDGADHVL